MVRDILVLPWRQLFRQLDIMVQVLFGAIPFGADRFGAHSGIYILYSCVLLCY